MYALQRLQRIGPNTPKSTIGGSYSPSMIRAYGDIIKAKGKAVVFSRSAVEGMQYNDDLNGGIMDSIANNAQLKCQLITLQI